MRLRRRVEAVEQRASIGSRFVPIVFWNGEDEDVPRRRVEAARARGQRFRVVQFAATDFADALPEAEAKVAAHREARPGVPITIYRRDSKADLLAQWDPSLPDWLQ